MGILLLPVKPIYAWRASLGRPALPVTRNRRYAGDEAKRSCFDQIQTCDLNVEAPSCLDDVGRGTNWRIGSPIFAVGTSRGPEGSRPTIDICRLEGCGVEERSQIIWVCDVQQLAVCPPLCTSNEKRYIMLLPLWNRIGVTITLNDEIAKPGMAQDC